jgi:hypothetical protein
MDKSLGSKTNSSEEWIDENSLLNTNSLNYEVLLLSLFISGDPHYGAGGYYKKEISRETIGKKLFEAGFIRNPKTIRGRFQLWIQLTRCHQTNYWKGYFFKQISEKKGNETLYDIRLDDVSGLPPG